MEKYHIYLSAQNLYNLVLLLYKLHSSQKLKYSFCMIGDVHSVQSAPSLDMTRYQNNDLNGMINCRRDDLLK